jgi:hypothetical protein
MQPSPGHRLIGGAAWSIAGKDDAPQLSTIMAALFLDRRYPRTACESVS